MTMIKEKRSSILSRTLMTDQMTHLPYKK